jgi:glycine dehydrogenase subunit 1
MLAVCGLGSLEDLYAHLPAETKLDRPLALPPGQSEYEILDYFKARAAENAAGYASFLGAGVYAHYRPVLCDVVASRGEFLTSYTPYQAEIAQGTLTTIFEFQTMVCQLTGMEVANASMYDGSTAVPEAALMAMRITGRERVLVARSVHPEYREVLATSARNGRWQVATCGYDAASGSLDMADLESKINRETACVIVQSPNFFGVLEQLKDAAALAHAHGALLIMVFTEAVSLGLLEPPREADIVAGELQSFAITPSYGGPFAGIIATREKYIRQIPGRLVGLTKDAAGNRAFCLTLSTREQHIRREKATSNICTNQALIALMATVFMSVYGKAGLPFFNEFVVPCRGRSPEAVNSGLLEKKIIGGLPLGRFYPELGNCLLLCATEMSKRADMDLVKEALLA